MTAAPGGSRPYAFLAFTPTGAHDRIIALAEHAVCSAGGWQPESLAGGGAGSGLTSWRLGADGAVLSLFLAGYLPLIAVLAPGGSAAGAVLAPGAARAVHAAVRRFSRAARSEGARDVATDALSALVSESNRRSARSVAIQGRLAQIAQADRVRECPRCAQGCDAALRWCPRCEYGFTPADEHARDQGAAHRRQEAEALQRERAQLFADAFPPPNAFVGVPLAPGWGWGGAR